MAIEVVVVIERDADGKLQIQKATTHSTRSGLRWGERIERACETEVIGGASPVLDDSDFVRIRM